MALLVCSCFFFQLLRYFCFCVEHFNYFYFLIFYKDKYIKKFERFRKMGCFLTFIYSVIGLTLLLLPIILLLAAI